MTGILTLTLNPALDLATSAASVRPGPKLRCDIPQVDPGGGGINVSRAIRLLGGNSTAFVALGGHTGARLLELLTAEGTAAATMPGPGETRQSFAVTDRTTGEQYRFVTPGPVWQPTDVDAALAAITLAAATADFVVLSGSLPPGVPVDFPTRLCATLAGLPSRVVIDTSGPALVRLAGAPAPAPFLLRMDSEEAEELAGQPLPGRQDSAAFAAGLVAKGVAQSVIVARGADGSVLASAAGLFHAAAADVQVRSKIGAGDSFVGGCVLALSRGETLQAALQKGAATASAAVMTEATELCHREDAERLVAECTLTQLG